MADIKVTPGQVYRSRHGGWLLYVVLEGHHRHGRGTVPVLYMTTHDPLRREREYNYDWADVWYLLNECELIA